MDNFTWNEGGDQLGGGEADGELRKPLPGSQLKNIDWLVSFGTLDQIEILCIYCVYRSWVIGRVKEVSNPPTHTG